MSTVILYRAFGGPEVLEVADETVPPPGPGEATVANRAIGVNPVDWKLFSGKHPSSASLPLPGVPGNEAAGVVTAVGEGVTAVAVGDEVLWRSVGGAYRAVANRPAAELLRIPAGLAAEQAAAVPVAGGTAYSTLHQLGIGADDTVLVHAAAGGVGSAVVQLARALGARVIGTASSGNHDYLASLGAEPVAYGPGLADRVRALGPITASIDTVGGAASVAATIELLGGPERAVTIAQNDDSRNAGIPGVQKPEDNVARALDYAGHGQLVFAIVTLPLSEAATAIAESQTGHVRGKLVLVP